MNMEHLRKDFPCLSRINPRNNLRPIYFDNACMTLKPIQVIDAMNEYYKKFPACGGHGRSAHWFSRDVVRATMEAREKIRRLIGAREPNEYGEDEIREIIWCRNTTEGINLIANAFKLEKGDEVITTDREHNSNLLPWIKIVKERGIVHKVVSSHEDGTFNIENFSEMMSKKVRLVSMVHTSNLDGYTVPVEEVIKIAHDYDAKVLIDGAQSVPHRRVNVKDMDVDFFAFSIHKMLGPAGMGVLYIKNENFSELDRFLVGGDTVSNSYYDDAIWESPPYLYEAGLQNYAGQIGAGAAADYLMKVGLDNIKEHEYKLNSFLTERMNGFDCVKILGPEEPRMRAGIVSFRLLRDEKEYHPADIARIMDEVANIMIRSGQHCVHSWFNAKGMGKRGSARASLYLYNTIDECKIFIEVLEKIINAWE